MWVGAPLARRLITLDLTTSVATAVSRNVIQARLPYAAPAPPTPSGPHCLAAVSSEEIFGCEQAKLLHRQSRFPIQEPHWDMNGRQACNFSGWHRKDMVQPWTDNGWEYDFIVIAKCWRAERSLQNFATKKNSRKIAFCGLSTMSVCGQNTPWSATIKLDSMKSRNDHHRLVSDGLTSKIYLF